MVWVVNAKPWRLFSKENLRTPWGNTGGTKDLFRRTLAKVKSFAILGIKLWTVQPIASIGVDVEISMSWRNMFG